MDSRGPAKPGKKEQLSRWIHATGVPRLSLGLPQRSSLLVINYHRIGDAAATPYDPAIFSATAAEFRAQVEFIARHLRPLSLPQALDWVQDGGASGRWSGCRTLITFDDGYLDNYDIACPILSQVGIPAAFFLPTSMVGSSEVPWWDVIAYIIKNARQRSFTLRYPAERRFDLEGEGPSATIRNVLNLYKEPVMLDADRFINELEVACRSQRPSTDPANRLFVNWDEVRRMVKGGMAVGSHSHSHRLLGRLYEHEQLAEMVRARALLREQAGVEADTIAYPVGLRNSFTEITKATALQAGYRAGFSYYGGINRRGKVDRYDLRRIGVHSQSIERFSVRMAAAIARTWWP